MRSMSSLTVALVSVCLVSCSGDESAWKEARTRSTVEDTTRYLTRYPSGAHAAEAGKKLRDDLLALLYDPKTFGGVRLTMGSEDPDDFFLLHAKSTRSAYLPEDDARKAQAKRSPEEVKSVVRAFELLNAEMEAPALSNLLVYFAMNGAGDAVVDRCRGALDKAALDPSAEVSFTVEGVPLVCSVTLGMGEYRVPLVFEHGTKDQKLKGAVVTALVRNVNLPTLEEPCGKRLPAAGKP
jgi:hypothetical protein